MKNKIHLHPLRASRLKNIKSFPPISHPKLLLLFLVIFAFNLASVAQTFDDLDHDATSGALGGGGSSSSALHLYSGFRSFEVPHQKATFFLVDDLSRIDTFYNDFQLNAGSVLLGADAEFSVAYKTDAILGFQGHLGRVRGLGLTMGASYRLIDSEHFTLRPGASLLFGNRTLDLGSLNPDSFAVAIVAEADTQFFVLDPITVKLRSRNTLMFQPHLSVEIPSIKLRCTAGFNLQVLRGRSNLIFEGIDEEEADVQEEIDTGTNRTGFLVNQQQVRNFHRFGISGFYFQIGIALR